MNVTDGRFKNRQLHIEDYLQVVSAEQREDAEVFAYQRIAENKDIITEFWNEQSTGIDFTKTQPKPGI